MTTPATPSVFALLRSTNATVRFLLLGAFINQLGFFIQAFLVVFMLARTFTPIQAGLGVTLLGVGAVAGTLIGATLGGRIGNRNAVIAGTLALAGSVAAAPFLVTPALPAPVWGATILLMGLFGQLFRPPAATILSQHIPADQQAMGFSMYRIALNLGATLGPLLATALSRLDWAAVFWVNAACSLAFAVIAFLKLPNDRPVTTPDRPAAAASSASQWGQVLTDGRFLAFLGAMLLSSMVYIQVFSTLPMAIEASGKDLAVYSTLLTISSAMVIAMELKITALVKRYAAWMPALVGTTVLCLSVSSFGLTMGSTPGLILSVIFMVLGLMTSGPTMFAYPASFPLEVRGKYIGANQAAFSAGNALGPIAGVALFRAEPTLVWVGCLALTIASAGLILIGMRPARAGMGAPASA